MRHENQVIRSSWPAHSKQVPDDVLHLVRHRDGFGVRTPFAGQLLAVKDVDRLLRIGPSQGDSEVAGTTADVKHAKCTLWIVHD